MPYTFSIDKKDNVIRETWTGIFDLEQLKDSCYAEWSHPDYLQGLNLLSDLRLAKGRVSVDEVLQFASWFSNDDAPRRHAIVVRRERALDFAGMFSMIRETDNQQNHQTRLFFSYAEAEAWVTGYRLAIATRCQEEQVSSQIAVSEG
jgi:hypothetical protein